MNSNQQLLNLAAKYEESNHGVRITLRAIKVTESTLEIMINSQQLRFDNIKKALDKVEGYGFYGFDTLEINGYKISSLVAELKVRYSDLAELLEGLGEDINSLG